MGLFPVLVKSVRHWFKREFPAFPQDKVCFQGIAQDVNPYDCYVVVCYTQEDYLFRVLGFRHYGSADIVDTLPTLPAPQAPTSNVAFDFQPSMDDIKAYIDALYPEPNPVMDLFILTVGRYDWHHVLTIPLECLQYVGMPLPTECTPELQDYQTFYKLGLRDRPRHWFNVDLSRVPNELAKHLVLYKGGKVHLPGAYVWHVVVRTFDSHEKSTHLQWIKTYCENRQQRTSTKRPKRRREHVRVIDSVEETKALMPPCMERLVMHQKHFPYDQERQLLVRTWARAGVELQVVGDILDELNERYPRDGRHVPTQRRWDYVAHYNRGYAPPSCEKMHCPLAPGQAIDVKKAECFKLFMERFPDKKPYARGFYGPIKWYEW